MPIATTNDAVRLYFEETGRGTPIIFVHEFADDYRSWELQFRHFEQHYRCIAFNARGYPPSDVPESTASLLAGPRGGRHRRCARPPSDSQDSCRRPFDGWVRLRCISVSDIPNAPLSLCVAGCGYGAEPSERERFRSEAEAFVSCIQAHGMAAFAEKYAYGPTRVQLKNKDPRSFVRFKRRLAEHSAVGSANTQLGVQRDRPSLYDLTDQLKSLTMPTLVLAGDEDWPCLAPGVLLKRTVPSAAFAVMPNCGHAINIEEPDGFNHLVANFLTQVDSGRWPMRDPLR